MGSWLRGVFAAALISTGTSRAMSLVEAPVTSLPVITTPANPANYVVSPPSGYDSVAKLIINRPTGTFLCSGSLVGGDYILTAAHCIARDSTTPTVNSLSATFTTGSGQQTFSGAAYYVPPQWTGNFLDGYDIALVRLSTATGLTPYDIFRVDNPYLSGVTIDVAGYGKYGLGSTGVTGDAGTLRAGYNTLDGVAFGDIPGLPFAWDFDDGLAAHDALGLLTNQARAHLGLGASEVGIAPGDSGGPTFIGTQVAGVHSFGSTYGTAWGDIDAVLNSSFGELSGDTRVAEYAGWLDSVMQPIPEPGTVLLLAGGLAAVLVRRRRPGSL